MKEDDREQLQETGQDEVEELEVRPLDRDELEARIETLEAENEQLQDRYLRKHAELVNFRRRVEKERGELAAVARADFLVKLLPILDDFERAAESEGESIETYQKGMKLIVRSVQSLLAGLGVERFEPLGETFDPRNHEAIARQEAAGIPDGRILEVYQAGYRLGDKLVRPAAVVVAFGGPTEGASTPADDDAAGGEPTAEGSVRAPADPSAAGSEDD